MIETAPRSKDDLLGAFEALAAHDLEFWLEIDPERFSSPFGEAWSPADNVRHLIKSTTPVTWALRLPRLALLVLFGLGDKGPPTYADVVVRYRAVLAEGAKAGARYSPSPVRLPADLRAWQQDLVSECRSAVRALERVVGSWDERDLDQCRLPHPLMGKLTVREMLFFTLYHYEHHRNGVAARIAAATAHVE